MSTTYNKVENFIYLALNRAKYMKISEEILFRDFLVDLKDHGNNFEILLKRFQKVTPLEKEVLASLGLTKSFNEAKKYLEKVEKGS